jgi:hypothetical protein
MQRLRTRLRAGATAFPPATFALNFLTGALDSGVTFSRGSNATLVDSTGKITYAPANLLLQSQTFDNASWNKFNSTINANVTSAPDGTSTADALVENTTSGNHIVQQFVSYTSGASYTFSLYVKEGTRSWARITMPSAAFGTEVSSFYNLSGAGSLGTASGPVTARTITAVGNGWYRVTLTGVATATAGGNTIVYAASADNTSFYTGVTGAEAIFIWGAQLEPVTYQTTPSTYVATTTAAYYGPRFDYDPVTLAAKGLLIEEQRTNLLTYSEQFDNAIWVKGGVTVSVNATTSPDGTATADKIVEDTSTGNHNVFNGGAGAAGAHTMSVFAKPAGRDWIIVRIEGIDTWFNVASGTIGTIGVGITASIAPAANGFYRCTITKTLAGATACTYRLATGNNISSYTGDGTSGIFLYGAQLEAGAFATSYIPTVASQVTRSADVATMTGTNFSSWYNQSEGTFVADFDVLVSANAVAPGHVLAATTASTQNNINRIWMWNGTPGVLRNTVNSGGVNSAELTGPTTVANTIFKVAAAYRVNDYAFATNGGAVATDTSGAVPVGLTLLGIGQRGDTALENLNGHIRQIAYYNTRLPNATLQALSA